MKEELVDKINLLIEKYDAELKEKGIRCTVSKRDIKIPVLNFFLNHGLLDSFFHKLTEKREKKLYHNKPDKSRVVILSFSPADKKKTDSKDFAFTVKTVSRIGKGFKPTERTYNSEKLLQRVEKRIRKMLKKADGVNSEKLCRRSFSDNLRYLLIENYNYKKKVFGISRDVMEVGFIIAVSLVLAVLVFVL